MWGIRWSYVTQPKISTMYRCAHEMELNAHVHVGAQYMSDFLWLYYVLVILFIGNEVIALTTRMKILLYI